MRGQDIYSSQEETTFFPSSSGSEDEVKGEKSSEEVYPHEEGDLLMVRRLLGGQSCDLSQSQRENRAYKDEFNCDIVPMEAGHKAEKLKKQLRISAKYFFINFQVY